MSQHEPTSQPVSPATSRFSEWLTSFLRWQIKRDIKKVTKMLEWCEETSILLNAPAPEIKRAKSELERMLANDPSSATATGPSAGIWRAMLPSHPLPCPHKWKRYGELYVKCEKCGELAVYIGGQR